MNYGPEYIPPRQAQRLLGCSYSTLRRKAEQGVIQTVVLPSGHRLFKIPDYFKAPKVVPSQKICYCRVSTRKQASDLDNQIKFCQKRFPHHQIITDIGSGLNWKRKGLKTILDRVHEGSVSEIVVAHKDRLSRFGFELLEYIFQKHQVKLVVLNQEIKSQLEDFSDDIISIITVFSARYYGKRKYQGSKVKKNKTLLKLTPKRNI